MFTEVARPAEGGLTMKRLTTRVHGKSSLVKGMSIFDIEEAIDHLVTIEDILGEEYDLDELKEVIQAKREGRCIVLPCKKGDTVWRIVHDAAPHITKDRCTDIKYENRDIWVHLIGDRVMGGWNFGKLLFLTREDAEAALRREQE